MCYAQKLQAVQNYDEYKVYTRSTGEVRVIDQITESISPTLRSWVYILKH